MGNTCLKTLCAFASMAVMATASSEAKAQAEPEAESSGIDIITVTAQRREESIQDVPVAVTALGANALDSAKIEDNLDLQFNVPNVVLSANRNVTIRGVGSQSFGGSNDAGIGVLVNGIFIQAPSSTPEFYDLERIEVLRGPQGTLFGRNTTGGVINYITKRPDEDFGGYVSAQIESFSGIRVNSAVNVPITDKLFQRIAFNYLNRDGYTFNEFNDSRIDGRNQYSVRSSTRFLPSSDTTVDFVFEITSEDSSRGGAVKTLCTPDPAFGCSSDSVSTDFPEAIFPIDNIFLPGIARTDIFAPNSSDLRTVNIDVDPVRDVEEVIGTLEISHDFGNLVVKSITGYRRGTLRSLRDFDQGFAPFGFNPGTFNTPTGPVTLPDDGFGNGILTYLRPSSPTSIEAITTTAYNTAQTVNTRARQWSTEAQLNSEYDGWFNFIVGGYYLTFNYRGEVNTYTPAARTLGFIASGNTSEATTEAYAVFGEAYIDVTDTIKLTGGLRYTIDDKTINTASGTFALGPAFIAEESFEELTWRAAISWTPEVSFTDDTNLYASASHGFKSGGFNPGSELATGFDSEFITAYEIGIKNLMFNNRLQTNIAAFLYDYENLIVGNIVGTLARNVNIPKTDVRGLEIELVAQPVEGLRFEAALGLLDTEIESDFLSSDPARGFQPFQLQGNELFNSPSHTLKIAAEYEWEVMPGWLARPRVDFYTQSEYFSREFNDGAGRVDSWKQLDLQLTAQSVDHDIAITFFVKNVLNEDSITFLETNSNLVGSFRSAFLLDPRIFGGTVRVGF